MAASEAAPEKERYDRERMARRVKSFRIDLGWDQSELAEQSGLSKDTVASIESGRRGATLDTAIAIADALGKSLEDVVCREFSAVA